jgi:large subunit ribosomal protein L25
MTRPKLSAQPRTMHGKVVKRLRRDGVLPAVVYGQGRDSQPIQLDAHEFELLRRRTGANVLVDLALDGGRPQPVLVHDVQEHPVTRATLHVDFLVVNMTEERTVDVPVSMVGTSEAVDRMGGILLHVRDTVQVRALPDDLPASLELDITPLDSFDAVLHASALAIPDGVTLVTDPAESLARVQPPRIEEEPVVTAVDEEGEAVEPAEEVAEGEEAADEEATAQASEEE